MRTFDPANAHPRARKAPARWGRWVLIALLLGLAAWTGTWTAEKQREAALEKGRQVTRQVAENLSAARRAVLDGETARAEALLEAAVALMRQVEAADRGPVYPIVLTDLATIKLSAEEPSNETIGEAMALLDEAWLVAPLADKIERSRIALQRGYAEVLITDLVAARQWFGEALALDPRNENVRAKIRLIEASQELDAPAETDADGTSPPTAD